MSDLTRTQTCWHTFQCVVRITKNEKKIKTIVPDQIYYRNIPENLIVTGTRIIMKEQLRKTKYTCKYKSIYLHKNDYDLCMLIK